MESVRFVADCMLGRLARWLRILGFDTLYFREISDPDLLSLHKESGRVLLTRDTVLIRSRDMGRFVFIYSDHWETQIREVASALRLQIVRERIFTRCLLCNAPLTRMERREVLGRVPDFVAYTQQDFRECRICGKIFWPGTHRIHMSRILGRIARGLVDPKP